MSFLYTQQDVGSQTYKDAVRTASTADVPLTGATPLSIGGVTVANKDRILLKDQSTGSQNGIYSVSISGGTYTLSRSIDANVSNEVRPNMLVPVQEGTHVDRIFQLITNGPIVLGTTALVFDYAVIYDHGLLVGLGDDDHTQYHNDTRALTWLGTRSTADLPENVNYLYFTDARAQSAVVTQVITNGVTNKAPSEDAVYDALALKVTGPASSVDNSIPVFDGLTGKLIKDSSGLLIESSILKSSVDGGIDIGQAASNRPGSVYVKTKLNLDSLTASRVIVSNASKDLEASSVSSTELGFLSGVTSSVQNQLNDREKKGYYTRITKSANYSIATTDDYIGCDSSGGSFTVTLPAANTVGSGKRFIIKDEGGAATTNNIFVAPNGTDKIDGVNASESLVVNYESITLICDGASKWFII